MPTRHKIRTVILSGRPRINDPRFGVLRGWYDFFDTACLFQESGTGSATTPVASIADPIGRIVNKVNAGAPYFYASSDSKRPTYRAFGSTFCARFDGTDDDLISSDTTYWNFMHTGAGFLVVAVLQITDANPETDQTIFDNTNVSSASRGFWIQYQDAGVLENRIRVGVSNGGGAGTSHIANYDGLATQTRQKLIVASSHSGGTSRTRFRLAGAEVLDSSVAFTPSGSAATIAARIGLSAGASPERMKGDLAQLLVYETPAGYSQASALEAITASIA